MAAPYSSPITLKDGSSFQIDYLSNHREHALQLARWDLEEWPEVCHDLGIGSVESLHESMLADNPPNSPHTSIPFTIIGLENQSTLVAMATLAITDTTLAHVKSLSPWLVAVYVTAGSRGKGIAPRLVERMEWEAFERLRFPFLYLWCEPHLVEYYRRLGFEEFDRSPYLKYPQVVHMRKRRV